MTLPELLVSITVIGLIIAVLASSVIVTFRTQSSTEGRLNVARAEQTIGMWLPADLASADDVSDDPGGSACPGETTSDGPCPGMHLGPGSNALLITWSTLVSDNPATGDRTYNYTYVSYYYSQADNGTFTLTRIECTKAGVTGSDPTGPGWNCSAVPVVTNLPAAAGWHPGDDVPDEVIAVTIPLDAAATDDTQTVADGQNTKNARRVIVTVHGGGTSEGAGGGRNSISITAGGTYRTEIDATSMLGAPTFIEARSKCGGPLTLVIDESTSISATNMTKVRTGIREFVKTLAGTPVKLEIITFSDRSRTLGTSGWSQYFDLTDHDQVVQLIGNPPYTSGGLVDQIKDAGGGATGKVGDARTNWEDAMFRAFRTSDGLIPQVMPKTLIFFTDGIPSRSRINSTPDGRSYRSDTQNPVTPVTPPEWGPTLIPATPTDVYYGYQQVAWNRANHWANQARGTVQKMVGVFVGDALTDTSAWISSPGVGYHMGVVSSTWESNWDFESRKDFEKAATFETRTTAYQARLDYEQYDGSGNRSQNSNWFDIAPGVYYPNQSNIDYRIRTSSGVQQTRGWYNITQNEWNLWRSQSSANFQAVDAWGGTTEALYDLNNTTTTDTDGWRIASWGDIGPTAYYANSTNHKYRINGVRSSYYDVTPTEFYTHRDATTDWQIRSTSNRSPAWYSVTQAEYNTYRTSSPGGSGGWRQNDTMGKIYGGSAPFDGYDAPVSNQNKPNVDILGELIQPGGAVQATWNSTTNSWNESDADLYATTNWDRLGPALKSIALGECGGTLTLQTRRGGSAVSDPFVYQNSAQWDASGNALSIVPSTVTTNLQTVTGTFDFEINEGLYRVVEVVPHNLTSIGGYSPAGWQCSAGVRQLAQGPLSVATNGFEVFSVPNSSWTGVRVRVGANEAVSCTQQVTGG